MSGCQITYLMKSAYHQASLLAKRVPIEKALQDPSLTDEQKRKLRLAEEARAFAERELGLTHTDNYTSFVQLDRPYVTYVVSAAQKNELKAHLWSYPLVGSLPYKGYFNPDDAKEEAERMKAEGFDVYVRGVSAYSTLGWFNDPLLSSMLGYRDHDLVDTVIHETVHATVYIKSQADFNERMAVFFGGKGAEAFYRAKEGADGPTLKAMAAESADEKLFSDFIFREMKTLENWYAERNKDLKGAAIPENERLARIKEIQTRFASELRPKFQNVESYKGFEQADLNNARLLTYRLYFENLDDFETVFNKLGRDFKRMLEFCKSLEKSKDPKADLAARAAAP